MKPQFKMHASLAALLGVAVSISSGNVGAAAPGSNTSVGASSSWDYGAPVRSSPVATPGGGADSGASAADVSAGRPNTDAQVAAIPATPTWTNYYRSIDAIHADTVLTQAQIENAKLHHDLEQARHGVFNDNGAARTSSGSVNMMAPGQPPAAPVASQSVQRSAVVQEVSMVDGRWTANIQLASGARVTVHPGDSVRGLGKIANVDLGQVSVEQGGKLSMLQFAGESSQDAWAQPSGQTIHPILGGMPAGLR